MKLLNSFWFVDVGRLLYNGPTISHFIINCWNQKSNWLNEMNEIEWVGRLVCEWDERNGVKAISPSISLIIKEMEERAAQRNGVSERRPKLLKGSAASQSKTQNNSFLCGCGGRSQQRNGVVVLLRRVGWLDWACFSLWVNGAGTAQCSAKKSEPSQAIQPITFLLLF